MPHILKEPKYHFFPIGEIDPKGWLMEQLKTQAAGLGGKLDLFWPDIARSRWIGGDAESWERVPYWLDGFIPLAALLRDEGMTARARRYVDEILNRQQDDGWLCPCEPEERKGYDLWALFLILKVLTVWHDATGDGRIEGAVRRALLNLDRHIDSSTLFGWAQTRWFEALIPIFWLYERTGEAWLPDLAVKLRAQGFDWVAFFDRWPMKQPQQRGRWSQMNHVVNQAMMLKSGPLYARLSHDAHDEAAAERMLALLDKWHGTVTGLFTGDECLAGKRPTQGTELCAVVDAMYSLEWLLALTGDAHYADRLERVAYNMLPATFSPDMQAHQYVQQANQPECSRQNEPVFLTNGPEANLFGVEPNYGCCTANMHQGWPKLAASVFMKSACGVAVMLPLPAELNTQVKGVPVHVAVETEYPFKGRVSVTVAAAEPVAFELAVRIPGWARGASAAVDGIPAEAPASGYLKVARVWHSSVLILDLPMPAALEPRPDGLYAVTRGALVYSLPVGERWVRQNKQGAEDMPWLNNWEVFPTTKWNKALAIDPADPGKELVFYEHPVGTLPFSPDGAPVTAKVMGRSVPWGVKSGTAEPLPSGDAAGPLEELTLIPYGCTNLRMTELPLCGK